MTQTIEKAARSVIKKAANNPKLRVCYKSNRAVSTIQKMENGMYQVVKLYECEVLERSTYNEASKEAMTAAMTQAPRTTVDAA